MAKMMSLFPKNIYLNLKKRLDNQKNIDIVKFSTINNANHFFKNKEKEMVSVVESIYRKKNIDILTS